MFDPFADFGGLGGGGSGYGGSRGNVGGNMGALRLDLYETQVCHVAAPRCGRASCACARGA
jgi:hypothetical protein